MRVSNFLQIAIGSFGTAWMPYALSIMKEEGNKKIYSKVFEFYIVCLTAAIAIILLFRKELLEFFAPDYFESYHTIAWLLLFNFIMGTVYVLTIGLHVKQKTQVLSWAAIACVLSNFGVSIVLVKFFGINGIAIGSVVGALAWILIQHHYSQKHFHIGFSYLKTLLVVSTLLIPLICSQYLDTLFSNTILLITIKVMACLVIIGFVYTYVKRNKSLEKNNSEISAVKSIVNVIHPSN